MQQVTSDWLDKRGDLHDATVTDVRQSGSSLEIDINDEWFNERGLTLPEDDAAPGKLVVEDFTAVEGEPKDAVGGWIYEILLADNQLTLQFCDRDPVRLRASAVRWLSDH